MAPGFKPNHIQPYDGKSNPERWLKAYDIIVITASGNDVVMENYLLVHLNDIFKALLMNQPANSIHSWRHLKRLFCNYYKGTWKRPSPLNALNQLHHRKGELLNNFMTRFCVARTVAPGA